MAPKKVSTKRSATVAGSPPPAALLAIVADPHVGNHARHGGPQVDGLNRRGRESVATFRRAVLLAKERGARVFAVAGDLFHSRRPEPAVIRAVQDVLVEARPMQVLLVPGNHDMLDASAASGNTALAPLFQEATIPSAPEWFEVRSLGEDCNVLAVPFEGSLPMEEHLRGVLGSELVMRAPFMGKKLLVTHVGLWDKATASPWQRTARDGMDADVLIDAMARAGILYAFVGNYHEPRHWALVDRSRPAAPSRIAYQVGTLCPASHGDAGLEGRGRMCLVNAGGEVSYEHVPGPRFVTTSGGPVSGDVKGCQLYVRWRGNAEEVSSIEGPFDGGEVVAIDDESAEDLEQDLEVSEAMAGEDTDEGAIALHVDKMELGAGVDRARVRELALDCWRKA